MRRWLGTAGLALALAGGAAGGHSIGRIDPAPQPAQKKAPPPRLEPFVGTLEEALAEAAARNVPLVVFAVLEGEEASERFGKSVPTDPAVAAAIAGGVLVIANAGEHPLAKVEETVDGKKTEREVCSVFLTPTCADHQRHWDPVFLAFQQQGELRCPQVLLVGPDGKVARRVAPGDVPRASQIASAYEGLAKKLGPGLTRAELAAQRAAVAEAEAAVQRGAHADAWRAWASALAVADHGKLADAARAGQAAALEALAGARDVALERLSGDDPIAGYDRLVELAASCKGLPNERELAKLVADAESAPRTRDVIAAHKKRLAAEALWQEIEALEAEKQTRKAEAKVRLLLRKYWDTEAGQRARKAYPSIAAEVDAKG